MKRSRKIMNEPRFPNRADIEEPLLRAIVDLGGSIDFSSHQGRNLEVTLAKLLGISDDDRDFCSPNYHSAGNRKWRNEIQFVRDQLVKKHELENAVRGRWTVTAAGYRRVEMHKR
jgi:hypothetical protein